MSEYPDSVNRNTKLLYIYVVKFGISKYQNSIYRNITLRYIEILNALLPSISWHPLVFMLIETQRKVNIGLGWVEIRHDGCVAMMKGIDCSMDGWGGVFFFSFSYDPPCFADGWGVFGWIFRVRFRYRIAPLVFVDGSSSYRDSSLCARLTNQWRTIGACRYTYACC